MPVASRLPPGSALVIGGFAVMAVSGVIWNGFGLFLVALEQEFGWSRGEISFGFTLFTLTSAATSPLVGWAFRHLDARLVLALLSACLVLGFGLASRVETLMGFYLTFGLLCGLGAQSCSSFALFTILGNWFRGRATLLSVADSGSGVGAFLGLPLLLLVMEAGGWRAGFLLLAAGTLLVVLPLNGWLMRLHPPDAPAGEPVATGADAPLPSRARLIGLGLAFFFGPFAYQALLTQQIALIQDKGVTAALAVWIAAAVGLTVFLCRLGAGWLIDRLGAAQVLRLALIAAVLTLACLEALIAFDATAMLYLYPALLAAGFGAQAIVLADGTRRIVPQPSFALVYGGMRLVSGFGIAAGPVLAGTIFDLTASYQLALLLILAAVLVQYLAFSAALRR